MIDSFPPLPISSQKLYEPTYSYLHRLQSTIDTCILCIYGCNMSATLRNRGARYALFDDFLAGLTATTLKATQTDVYILRARGAIRVFDRYR